MKKILAIALAAVMTLAVLAVAVNAEAEPALLITADQIAAEGNQKSAGVATVELVSDEGGFARITSAGDDPWIMITPVPTTKVENKYATFKYRTSSTVTLGIEVYTEIAEPHASAGADAFQNDGQWHTAVIDLSTAQDQWKGNISRIDPMNAAGLPAGEVIDIAWVAIFADENDAKAYTGPNEGEPAAPSDNPTPADNPGTADASVIAIAAVACVALAGVVVAKKVR